MESLKIIFKEIASVICQYHNNNCTFTVLLTSLIIFGDSTLLNIYDLNFYTYLVRGGQFDVGCIICSVIINYL